MDEERSAPQGIHGTAGPSLRLITFGEFLLLRRIDGGWEALTRRDLSPRGPAMTFLKVLLCAGTFMDSHKRDFMLGRPAWEWHEASRDQLIDALWSEEETVPVDPDRALATAKSVLNRALREAAHGDVIVLTDGSDKLGYRLNTSLVALDADEFEHTVAKAASVEGRGDHDQALILWEMAYSLVQGEFLPHDQYNDWSAKRRERLHGKLRLCLHRLTWLYAKLGRTTEAVEKLHPYVLLHPMDVDALCVLVPLLARQNRYEEALQLCDTCIQFLQDESKLVPQALREVESNLRQAQEAALIHLSRSLFRVASKAQAKPPTSGPPPSMETARHEAAGFIGKDDMEKKRREVLHLLSIAGAQLLLPLPDLDWDRTFGSTIKPSRLDKSVLHDLEIITTHLWNLYLAAPTKALVLDEALGHLKTLILFLKAPHSVSTHHQLCALVSDASQLVGELYFDLNDHDAARACYVFAASQAQEAHVYDLWACALTRYAFLPLYRERYQEALTLLQEALKYALRGDSSLPTRYWVAALEAEAQSGLGNFSNCQEALDRAQGVQDLKGLPVPWVRFHEARLPALRGACYIRLQQPELAIAALQEALHIFVKPDRKRAMALTDLAAAEVLRSNVEQAQVYVDEVMTILAHSSSGFLREGLRTLPHRVDPSAEQASVKVLDQYIRQQLQLPDVAL